MSIAHKLVVFISTLVGMSVIAGCVAVTHADMPKETATKLSGPKALVADVDSFPTASRKNSLDLVADGMFLSSPIVDSDPLPDDIMVSGLSFENASPYDVLRTVLSGTGISLTIRNEAASASVLRHSVSAVNVGGKLSRVLDKLSDSVGFYWSYKNGGIDVTPDNLFIANIPPFSDVFDSLPPMLQILGATNVFVDKTSHMATFRATRVAYERIDSYLKHIRDSKKMISFDVHVWQVVLDGAHSDGIQWDKLKDEIASSNLNKHQTSPNFAALGSGFSSTFGRGELSIDVLTNFLSKQGRIHAISQPKLSMISGGKSTFRVGNTTVYARAVGTDTASGVARTTVTTAQALSGIDLTVGGNLDGETVFTDIQMKLNDLLRFNSFSANGISVQMPQNANRELSTQAHIRPGDSLLLAGINIANSEASGPIKDAKETNTMTLPNSMAESSRRTELVMVFRPSVLSFSNEAPQPKANIEVSR